MNTENLKKALAGVMRGEVTDDADARRSAARDTSLFERMPALVAYPKDADDVSAIVKAVRQAHDEDDKVVLAARSAGTDMSGGPLTTGVVVSFMKHMNRMGPVRQVQGKEVGSLDSARDEIAGYAISEPGVYYRDFE